MKVIQPGAVTDAVLVTSSATENDAPAWSPTATYGAGARVIRGGSHRVYESTQPANLGLDPLAVPATGWIDVGPTNRWAMFDRALGSLTRGIGGVTVTLAPLSPPDALALLDVDGGQVAVTVTSGTDVIYSRTQAIAEGRRSVTFDGLPDRAGSRLTVAVLPVYAGASVAVGTLLFGTTLDLGQTETAPSIGIIDYSRRETDAFGVTTVVPRTWARSMTLRTKVDAAAVDGVQRQVAALRAIPALWIGEDGYDSLTIYGFFKSFSVDLTLIPFSYCSFSIEGLGA